jgi:hypothetical protein
MTVSELFDVLWQIQDQGHRDAEVWTLDGKVIGISHVEDGKVILSLDRSEKP